MSTIYDYFKQRYLDRIAGLRARRAAGEELTDSEWMDLAMAGVKENER